MINRGVGLGWEMIRRGEGLVGGRIRRDKD